MQTLIFVEKDAKHILMKINSARPSSQLLDLSYILKTTELL